MYGKEIKLKKSALSLGDHLINKRDSDLLKIKDTRLLKIKDTNLLKIKGMDKFII